MNKYDLFEAMNDIDETYIFRTGELYSKINISFLNVKNQNTEEIQTVAVVKRRKISLRVIVLIAVLALTVSAVCTAAFSDYKNKNKEITYEEEFKTKRFKEKENFFLPDNIEFIFDVCGAGDKLYIGAYAESDTKICIFDMNGELLYTHTIGKVVLHKVRTYEENKIAFIYQEYNERTEEVSFKIDVIDEEGVLVKSIRLNNSFHSGFTPIDFIIDKGGNIVVYDIEKTLMFDCDGEKTGETKTTNPELAGFFEADSEVYAVYRCDEGTEIAKIDLDNAKIRTHCVLDYHIKGIAGKNEEYDVFFETDDGVYGYSPENSITTEVADFVLSDIDTTLRRCYVLDENNIILFNPPEPELVIAKRTDE
ncbi:MAG: hypothetical protein E7505_10455 [Ruminococcus sp.]|nr:hypothetical protein [Ruminococcus sp.]